MVKGLRLKLVVKKYFLFQGSGTFRSEDGKNSIGLDAVLVVVGHDVALVAAFLDHPIAVYELVFVLQQRFRPDREDWVQV